MRKCLQLQVHLEHNETAVIATINIYLWTVLQQQIRIDLHILDIQVQHSLMECFSVTHLTPANAHNKHC